MTTVERAFQDDLKKINLTGWNIKRRRRKIIEENVA